MPPRATILVVGDEAELAALLRNVLVREGYRVLTATPSSAAVAALRAFRVQLLVADIPRHISAADHWSALDAVLAAAGDTPSILCAAQDAPEGADYAAHGHAALLRKPLDLNELLARVAALLPEPRRADTQGSDHALEQIV